MYQLNIIPSDKLFFRDAKPVGGSNIGNGSSWPLPGVFHSALQSAIYQYWDEAGRPDWESEHTNFSVKEKEKQIKRKIKNNYRFGGLKTIGVFPAKDGEIYFPTPADLESGGSLMCSVEMQGTANLPKPLKYSVANSGLPSKEKIGNWLSASDFAKYLTGENNIMSIADSDFYTVESAPGVAINPETRTNIDSKFYQAEYLRLNDKNNVSISAFTECMAKKFNGKEEDVLNIIFTNSKKINLIMGGQRGTAYVECVRSKSSVTDFKVSLKGNKIKWVLLTPAVFSNGWLPDWVDRESGMLMLKKRPHRNEYKSRAEWRKAVNNSENIRGSLVAARVPKPIAFSGWKLDIEKDNAGGQPKATRMAVPAGSVYYFECNNETEAKHLFNELHGKVKSTHYGAEGYGFGVCGNWELKNI